MNERDLFLAALEKPTAELRASFLSVACADDTALRKRLDALLQKHFQTDEFLRVPIVERLDDQGATPGAQDPTAGDRDEEPNDRYCLDFLAPTDQADALGRLGHYEVLEVVGTGGMGIVLRAFDERLHRVVAIKVMAAQLATNAASRKRFQREARAAAAVCHDHVVTIHAVEEAGGLPYLVMQLVSGSSLQERIDRDGPLAVHEIVRIGMQTASGLAAAHAQGLIHRDIKPANILLENGVERVKITDFGLARAAADASVSQAGVIAGTPQYMSPEQARGEGLDGRSDLFSLGSVLYAMCTGRAPFRATDSIATLKRVCDDSPSPIREANPDIPDWLIAVIDKLHAKNPSERFQSAAEVAQLLGQRLAELQNPSAVALRVTIPLSSDHWSPAKGHVSRSETAAKGRITRRVMAANVMTSRWGFAAAVLLCLALGLGFAEATGTTQLTSTIVRVFTPEGTLVVETNDPSVQVTVEGDGGLVITGAGLEEIRLRPGSYRVHADKNGQPIPLDRELVKVTRGGRAVVKVNLEAAIAIRATSEEEFTPLFNGQDLTGWASDKGGAGMWRIEDGALTCSGPRDHLITTRNDFDDFHLRAQVKINAGGNSGIYFRAAKPLVFVGDYEAQITDNSSQTYKTGALYGLVRGSEVQISPETWFTLEIIASGERIRILVNGVESASYREQRPGRNTRGHIALQHHDPQTRVRFRKIEIAHSSPKGAPSPAVAPFDAAAAKQHQEAWAKYLGMPVEFTNSVGMKFRLVPPGEFEMGSSPQAIEAARAADKYSDDQALSDALASEGPLHRVVISEPFYLGITEVTQREFETVTGQNPSTFSEGGANADKVRDTDTARIPAQGLSWNDAADFCSRLSEREGLVTNYRLVGAAVQMLPGNGYRLPREAQWEYACRAGTTSRFWFGDQIGDHADREWFEANSEGRPHTVGSLASNPFGLFDMHGNVSEWCQDGWNPEFYLMSKDRPAVDPLSKPKGPHLHMVRGGSWISEPAVKGRSAFRMPAVPSKRYESNGFRVALAVDSARLVMERQQPTALPSAEAAFVLLGGEGIAERKFDTLAEAVLRASDGDTIEVRGNGPFPIDPMQVDTPLVVRAGAGFRPIFLGTPAADAASSTLILAKAPLVLEGLEFRRHAAEPNKGNVVLAHEVPLFVANCRFVVAGKTATAVGFYSPKVRVQNSVFLRDQIGSNAHHCLAWMLPTQGSLKLTNSVLTGAVSVVVDHDTIENASLQIGKCTLRSRDFPLSVSFRNEERLPDKAGCVRIEVAHTVLDGNVGSFGFRQSFPAALPPAQAEKLFPSLIRWHERCCLHRASVGHTGYSSDQLPGYAKTSTLEEWNSHWGLSDTGTLIARPKYMGGDATLEVGDEWKDMSPYDFRLRPDSIGYRAGPDGKDLGADVDLVGPGEAYERWKQTPEYQEWLKETGQLRADFSQPALMPMVLCAIAKCGMPFTNRLSCVFMSDVTRILQAIDSGDPQAAEKLLPLVYAELRKLAAARLAQERPGQTLDATALVHEAYLRLMGPDGSRQWDGRGHFFAAAAEAMRRILIESARRKRARKHGGDLLRIDLSQIAPRGQAARAEPDIDELLALDEALVKLDRDDPKSAAIAKLRLFAGLTVADAALALGLSRTTGFRDWTYARAFLQAELQK